MMFFAALGIIYSFLIARKMILLSMAKMLKLVRFDLSINFKFYRGVLAEEFGRAAVESINHLQEFQAAMKRIGEILAE